MLVSTVVLPDSFQASHFDDKMYQYNMEALLKGIITNGLILVDAENSLYDKLYDQILLLANMSKGKKTQVLFEELVKKHRQKIVRFVKTECSFQSNCKTSDVASSIATKCMADFLLTESGHYFDLSSTKELNPAQDYIGSRAEAERKRCLESLPSLDQMPPGEFDRLIVKATRFSQWLRFYDKQIGKGDWLRGFIKGMDKILQLWTNAAHFPKNKLSIELYTVSNESNYRKLEPLDAYNNIIRDLVEPLQKKFGIRIKLFFKRDADSKCHDRFLQTQSLAIQFSKGFDFFKKNGSLCRTFITLGGDFTSHLQEVRQLPDYSPSSHGGSQSPMNYQM